MIDVVLVPFILVIKAVLSLIVWVVVADVIMGWLFVADILNPNGRFIIMIADALSRMTSIMLDPIRRYVPCMFGSLDLSPLVLILIVSFFENVLTRVLLKIA